MIWNSDNTILIDPPKKPKKITGTRLGAILGTNRWSTPFEAWCAITRTYEKPFEETIYTRAGKAIEPKQAEFIRTAYGIDLTSPTDVWGKDYFKKTYGDFFPDSRIFGGMWDFLEKDENGDTVSVFEMKTTKRAEDWADDIPEYYAIQAALYAYLLGVDQVYMVCTILQEDDYEHPDDFVCTMENTFVRPFKVSERYDMHEVLTQATHWWNRHVKKGISPAYDETADAEILAELRKNNVSPDSNMTALVAEAEGLMDRIDAVKTLVADDEKRLKKVLDMIKDLSVDQFRDGDADVVVSGRKYDFVTSKSLSMSVDKDQMLKDGILDKYTTSKESYTLRKKERKADVH
jgi:predicted phage-related endonuclease